MIPEPIRELLDELYERYDTPGFIEDDPISVPHGFTCREDIEIARLPRRDDSLGQPPLDRPQRTETDGADGPLPLRLHDERIEERAAAAARLRPQNIQRGATASILSAPCAASARDGSLGGYFEREYAETRATCGPCCRVSRTAFWSADHRREPEKHLSSIDRGASCKRLCMYLKWMVRDDGRGVDFGLWKSIPPAALYLPLDVHTGHMGRALGLLARKQNDWKAVEEITASLRTLDASDPVKYDFALIRRRDRRIPEIESRRESVPSFSATTGSGPILRLRRPPFVAAGLSRNREAANRSIRRTHPYPVRNIPPRKEHSENPETGYPQERKVARPGSRGFPHHLTDRAPLRDMATPLSPPCKTPLPLTGRIWKEG